MPPEIAAGDSFPGGIISLPYEIKPGRSCGTTGDFYCNLLLLRRRWAPEGLRTSGSAFSARLA